MQTHYELKQTDKFVIYGAGGFAREVLSMIYRDVFDLDASKLREQFHGFVSKEQGDLSGFPVLDEKTVDNMNYVPIVAVGSPRLRKKIVEQLGLSRDKFPTLISKTARVGMNVVLGNGVIVCDNSILTCDIKLLDFVNLNLATTVGHDVCMQEFATTAPGVHISGNVKIGEEVYLGTGSTTVEKLSVADKTIIGAGAVIVKTITDPEKTWAGVPAKELIRK